MITNDKGQFIKGNPPWNKGLTKDDSRVMKYVKSNYTPRYIKFCKLCLKTYEVIESRKNKALFCSVKCKSRWLGDKFKNPYSFDRNNHNAYIRLHNWVNKYLGKPKICEVCNDTTKTKYHWANKTGKYMQRKNDWIRLCPKCHYKYDMERGIRQFAP